MSEIEDRALERIEVRRGDRPPPAVTIETPGTDQPGPIGAGGAGGGQAREPLLPPPGSAAFPPGAGGATAERLARALVARPIEAAAGAVRTAGAMAEAAFNPVNMLDDLQGALQNVSPVLMNRAIEEGAVQPLGSVNDVLQQDDGGQYLNGQRLDPNEVVVWRGEVYPRRFIDPAGTGRTFDFSMPAPADSTMDPTVSAVRDVTDVGADRGWVANAATRLGRLFMAVMPDPLGGGGQASAAAHALVKPQTGLAARSGVGAVEGAAPAARGAENAGRVAASTAREAAMDGKIIISLFDPEGAADYTKAQAELARVLGWKETGAGEAFELGGTRRVRDGEEGVSSRYYMTENHLIVRVSNHVNARNQGAAANVAITTHGNSGDVSVTAFAPGRTGGEPIFKEHIDVFDVGEEAATTQLIDAVKRALAMAGGNGD